MASDDQYPGLRGARELVHAAVAAAAALVTAVIPLYWNRQFYWADDTVNGAFGQWFHLGSELRAGRLPMLEPSAWASGNLFAEGQWGHFSPVSWTIALGSTVLDHAALYVTLVKVVFIVVGAVGVYALARDLDARAPLAVAAGVTAPFTGLTAYFDSPSWATGLFVWALMPWFWYQLRRLARGHGGPLRTFAVAYLIVSVGYVHGTIALIFVIVSVLVHAVARRDRGGFVRVLVLGFLAGLVTVAVHLPSLLTGPVTLRADRGIFMDQYMSLDVTGLLMAGVPSALPQATSWWWAGLTATVPMAYMTWAAPTLAFLRRRAVGIVSRDGLDLLVGLVLFLAFTLLPTVVGPLRYPARMLPYVGLVAIVLLAVGLSRSRDLGPVPARRLIGAASLVLVGTGLAWAQTPSLWLRHGVSLVLVGLAVAALWFTLNRDGAQEPQGRPPSSAGSRLARLRLGLARPAAAVVVVAVVTTWAVSALQHRSMPSGPWGTQNVPASVSALQEPLAKGTNDAIVIGDPLTQPLTPELWHEVLQANLWYLGDRGVLNRYQLLGFDGFNQTLCLGYLGSACQELLPRLFDVRRATGLTLVDELQLDTIAIVKGDVASDLWESVPDGWSVADDGTYLRTWVRDEPIGPAGGVITSSGASVTEISRSDTEVSFRVDDVSAHGGRVVLSRLPWPGYSTDVGSIGQTTDDFLLTIDVPSGTRGEVVTVTFRPAGWPVVLAALVVGVGGAVAWGVGGPLLRRRRTSERA